MMMVMMCFFTSCSPLCASCSLTRRFCTSASCSSTAAFSARTFSTVALREDTCRRRSIYDKLEELFMIMAEGFKPRRQGLCPPSQPPAAVLSSSPPVPSKHQHHNRYQFLSGANKMIMVSKNRHHNGQHCQVDQSLDLQLPLPLEPLHQLPAPPLLLLNPLLAPYLNKVMRGGGPFLVLSRSG